MSRTDIGQPRWRHRRRVLAVGAAWILAALVLSLGVSPAGATPGGSISGTVFFDMDGDGGRGPDERGLQGVTLSLTGPGCDATVITDADGFYRFDGLSPGSYTVAEQDPAGYLSTTPNSVPVSVQPNGTYDGVDFGDALPVTLTGVVFEDQDQDGQQAPGEAGVAGALVTLYPDADRDQVQDPGAPSVATTTSFDDGGYILPDLLPAWYVLVVEPPPGYVNTTPNVLPLALVSGEVAGVEAPAVGLAAQAPTAVTLSDFSGRSGAGRGVGETMALVVGGLAVAGRWAVSRRRRG